MNLFDEIDYYHGYIDMKECKNFLQENGDFLVRNTMNSAKQSENVKIKYVLCVAVQAAMKPDETDARIRALAINFDNEKYSIVGCEESAGSLKELIEMFQTNKKIISGNILLIRSVARQAWELSNANVQLSDEVLGKGSFGSVVKGKLSRKDQNTPIDVAVKKLIMCENETKFTEVLQEARTMRHFNHPNVIKLHGVVVESHPVMIVIEYVDGNSLANMLRANKIPNGQRIWIVGGLMYGLKHVHDEGFIHRDVAARNVLLSADCRDVKLIDFGLSRKGTTYTIQTPQKIPTKWLSPEVIHRGEFSVKSDVWAFAVTIWEIYNNGAEPYPSKKTTDVKAFMMDAKSAAANRLTLQDCSSEEKPPPDLNEAVRVFFEYLPANRPAMDKIVAAIETGILGKMSNPNKELGLPSAKQSQSKTTSLNQIAVRNQPVVENSKEKEMGKTGRRKTKKAHDPRNSAEGKGSHHNKHVTARRKTKKK